MPDPKHSEHLDYLLTAYLFESLSAAGKAEVETHLAACPACREQLAELRATLTQAEDAFAHDATAYVFEARRKKRVIAGMYAAQRRPLLIRNVSRSGWGWVLKLGGVAAVLLLILSAILPTLGRTRMSAKRPGSRGVEFESVEKDYERSYAATTPATTTASDFSDGTLFKPDGTYHNEEWAIGLHGGRDNTIRHRVDGASKEQVKEFALRDTKQQLADEETKDRLLERNASKAKVENGRQVAESEERIIPELAFRGGKPAGTTAELRDLDGMVSKKDAPVAAAPESAPALGLNNGNGFTDFGRAQLAAGKSEYAPLNTLPEPVVPNQYRLNTPPVTMTVPPQGGTTTLAAGLPSAPPAKPAEPALTTTITLNGGAASLSAPVTLAGIVSTQDNFNAYTINTTTASTIAQPPTDAPGPAAYHFIDGKLTSSYGPSFGGAVAAQPAELPRLAPPAEALKVDVDGQPAVAYDFSKSDLKGKSAFALPSEPKSAAPSGPLVANGTVPAPAEFRVQAQTNNATSYGLENKGVDTYDGATTVINGTLNFAAPPKPGITGTETLSRRPTLSATKDQIELSTDLPDVALRGFEPKSGAFLGKQVHEPAGSFVDAGRITVADERKLRGLTEKLKQEANLGGDGEANKARENKLTWEFRDGSTKSTQDLTLEPQNFGIALGEKKPALAVEGLVKEQQAVDAITLNVEEARKSGATENSAFISQDGLYESRVPLVKNGYLRDYEKKDGIVKQQAQGDGADLSGNHEFFFGGKPDTAQLDTGVEKAPLLLHPKLDANFPSIDRNGDLHLGYSATNSTGLGVDVPGAVPAAPVSGAFGNGGTITTFGSHGQSASPPETIEVPPDILAKAQLGDHFETINPDRPDTHSATANPNVYIFHRASDGAAGGGSGGKDLEDLVGATNVSPGTGGGWGGGNGPDAGSGRGSFGSRTGRGGAMGGGGGAAERRAGVGGQRPPDQSASDYSDIENRSRRLLNESEKQRGDGDRFLKSFGGDLDTDIALGNGREQAKAKLPQPNVELKMLDNRDLTKNITDFPGPRIDVGTAGDANAPNAGKPAFTPGNLPFPGIVAEPQKASGALSSEVGSVTNKSINFFSDNSDSISAMDTTNTVRQRKAPETISMWMKPAWNESDRAGREFFGEQNQAGELKPRLYAANPEVEFSPPVYETRTRKVLDKSEHTISHPVPSVFETRTRQVQINADKPNEAPIFRDEPYQVQVTPQSTGIESIPATYKDESYQVCVKPASTEWQKSDLTGKASNDGKTKIVNGEYWCLVDIPAVYETRTRRVCVTPQSCTTETIPGTFKDEAYQALVKPATVNFASPDAEEHYLRGYDFLHQENAKLTFPQFLRHPDFVHPLPLNDEGLGKDAYVEKYGIWPFIDCAHDNLSTFGMDVDTAAYTLARASLRGDKLPAPDAIHTEEFLNYFKQDYRVTGSEAFGVFAESAASPFVDAAPLDRDATAYLADETPPRELLKIGIKSRDPRPNERKPAMLTFVLDTSGSMNQQATKDGLTRLELIQNALRELVEKLNPEDAIGIVGFNGQAELILPRTPAAEKRRILDAVDGLVAHGATNVEAGLVLGYRMADEAFATNAVNRLIFCGDGVANVGAQGPDEMLQLVKLYAARGLELSTVGLGLGPIGDPMLRKLADEGGGSCHYADSAAELQKIFNDKLPPHLTVLARDAKVQVEFNSETIKTYRLIGYEKRKIKDADFRNDKVTAGEVTHSTLVTVLYEIVRNPGRHGALGKVFLRWKDAGSPRLDVVERNYPLEEGICAGAPENASPEFRFLACVARFAELLRHSKWTRQGSYAEVLHVLDRLPAQFKAKSDWQEVKELVGRAQRLSIAAWRSELK